MFGVFLGFGAIVFALVRAYSAPFLFFSIFGTIAIDIFCVCGRFLFYGFSSHFPSSGCRSPLPLCKLQNPQQHPYRRIQLLRYCARLLLCYLSRDRQPCLPWPDIGDACESQGNARVTRGFAIHPAWRLRYRMSEAEGADRDTRCRYGDVSEL